MIALPNIPTAEGVFALYRAPDSLMHYASAKNLRKGVFGALAEGWSPDLLDYVEVPHALSLERFLRRHKWDGRGIGDRVCAWKEWWSSRAQTADEEAWEVRLRAGPLPKRAPENPTGRRVWHRLAKEEIDRLTRS